ncbi:MAG: GNAT family N-acetyltransferase [Luteimonas sp.]
MDSAAIRTATAADAGEIARLSAQLGYPAETGVFAQRLTRLLASARHAVFVAVDARDRRRLHGLITAEHRLTLGLGEGVEIIGLVVDAAARRGGVGRALVDAAEGWARRAGSAEVFLRSNVIRPEAHPFYEGIGYLRTKTQHVYLKRLS